MTTNVTRCVAKRERRHGGGRRSRVGAALWIPALVPLADSHNPSSALDWVWVVLIWALVAVPVAALLAAVAYAAARAIRRRAAHDGHSTSTGEAGDAAASGSRRRLGRRVTGS